MMTEQEISICKTWDRHPLEDKNIWRDKANNMFNLASLTLQDIRHVWLHNKINADHHVAIIRAIQDAICQGNYKITSIFYSV